MGHANVRRKIAKAIPSWGCLGYFGYGHGRTVRDFGEKYVKDLSVCQELCSEAESCRMSHHGRMDKRYPQIADIVHKAAARAHRAKIPVVKTVLIAMRLARKREIPGADEIFRILREFRVGEMTDHFVCGQFQNIQNGLDGQLPANERPIPEATDEQ